MKRILFTLLCLGVLGTSGCYFDPALSGVSTSVGVGVGAYADDPYWDYYPYRDGWYNDWRYRRWDHRWNREHYRPYPYYHYDR
jgi:hypothetical protein